MPTHNNGSCCVALEGNRKHLFVSDVNFAAEVSPLRGARGGRAPVAKSTPVVKEEGEKKGNAFQATGLTQQSTKSTYTHYGQKEEEKETGRNKPDVARG